jgi:RNA polymerase sigma-70 factor (ECF subfamily)
VVDKRKQANRSGSKRIAIQWTDAAWTPHVSISRATAFWSTHKFHSSPLRRITAEEADKQAMIRLQRGEEHVLYELWQRYRKGLVQHLSRVLKDRADAQDVMQEAFVRVFQHRGNFDISRRFSTWLYTIALNLARSRLRSRKRQPEFVSFEELSQEEISSSIAQPSLFARDDPPDEVLAHRELSDALARAVVNLPEKLRGPFHLFSEEEKSQAEIASAIGCTVKTVEMRLYHARKRLGARLACRGFRSLSEGFVVPRRSDTLKK